MNETIDLTTYQLMKNLDADEIARSRYKIAGCMDKLISAGQFDAHQLAIYGLAYLKEIHEGRDPGLPVAS